MFYHPGHILLLKSFPWRLVCWQGSMKLLGMWKCQWHLQKHNPKYVNGLASTLCERHITITLCSGLQHDITSFCMYAESTSAHDYLNEVFVKSFTKFIAKIKAANHDLLCICQYNQLQKHNSKYQVASHLHTHPTITLWLVLPHDPINFCMCARSTLGHDYLWWSVNKILLCEGLAKRESTDMIQCYPTPHLNHHHFSYSMKRPWSWSP